MLVISQPKYVARIKEQLLLRALIITKHDILIDKVRDIAP